MSTATTPSTLRFPLKPRRGRKLPLPQDYRVTIRLTPVELHSLEEVAAQGYRKVTRQVKKYVLEGLDREGFRDKPFRGLPGGKPPRTKG